MIDKTEVGKRLATTREALKLSQTEFAASIGLKPSAYATCEAGSRSLSLDAAALMCKTHGATLDWLYLGDTAGLPARLLEALRRS